MKDYTNKMVQVKTDEAYCVPIFPRNGEIPKIRLRELCEVVLDMAVVGSLGMLENNLPNLEQADYLLVLPIIKTSADMEGPFLKQFLIPKSDVEIVGRKFDYKVEDGVETYRLQWRRGFRPPPVQIGADEWDEEQFGDWED